MIIKNSIERVRLKKQGINMARAVAIGEQDFGKIIGKNYFYIDKTNIIKEWWEN